MRLKSIQNLFLCLIVCIVIRNAFIQYPRIDHSINIIKHDAAPLIGQDFVMLIPYVHKIHSAGYINCRKSSHPLTDTAIMGPYQQAQFVLSPLILDYYHPTEYRYIIMDCYDDGVDLLAFQKRLGAHTVVTTPKGILLLERGGEWKL